MTVRAGEIPVILRVERDGAGVEQMAQSDLGRGQIGDGLIGTPADQRGKQRQDTEQPATNWPG
jgi:hypothetical protein